MSIKTIKNAVCSFCGSEFQTTISNKRFCNGSCAREFYKKSHSERNPNYGLSSGKVGAIHELVVCADLLKRGFSVFRAVSQSELFDIAIFKNGSWIRVEVTTGYRNSQGKIGHPKNSEKQRARFDLLAVVIKNDIFYYPPLT